MVAFLCAVSGGGGGGMAEKAIRFRLNCPHGLCRLISSRLFLAAACYCYCYTFYNMTKNQLWYVNNLNWMEKREACVRHKYLGFTQPPNTYAIVSSRFCSFKTIFWLAVLAKGQIKPKEDWRAVYPPKKWTRERSLMTSLVFWLFLTYLPTYVPFGPFWKKLPI